MEVAQKPTTVMQWLDGMIYKEVKTTDPLDAEKTITTKEYNWMGITILGTGASLTVLGIYKLGQAVLKR